MTRHALYSHGYGSGWSTSIHAHDQQKFALFYQPFIAAILARDPDDDVELIDYSWTKYDRSFHARIPADLLILLPEFLATFETRFPESIHPALSALEYLDVRTIPDGMCVQVSEHDGYEEIEYGNGWF